MSLHKTTLPWILFFVCFTIPFKGVVAVEVYSDGFFVPETLSTAPDDFGRFGGQIFVPDPGPAPQNTTDGRIWTVDPVGGRKRLFATGLDAITEEVEVGFRGGLFLPNDFGNYGGMYIVTSFTGISAFDPSGDSIPLVTADQLLTADRTFARLTTPILAPDDFGNLSGSLLVSYQAGVNPGRDDIWGGVISVDTDGTAEHFVTPSVADFASPKFRDNVFDPFGLVFAPDGFGGVGGKLLVSDATGDNIVAVDANRNVEPFAKVPIQGDQSNLRQMAFSPPEFGDLGQLLFVSVAGSLRGDGGEGAVHALDSAGHVRATLTVGEELREFDPRGLLFTDDGNLLISDASDVIRLTTADDFRKTKQLFPGDADRDFDFDQFDLILVQQAAKYRTGESATWREGDWNGAPGGSQWSPPVGDQRFDQRDIIAALQAGIYLTGSYGAARQHEGMATVGDLALIYHTETGELRVETSPDVTLSAIQVASNHAMFLESSSADLSGAFDSMASDGLFKATSGGRFASFTFGAVLPPGLTIADLAADLTVEGALAGGGSLDDFDLVFQVVPEPGGASLCLVALCGFAIVRISKSCLTMLRFS